MRVSRQSSFNHGNQQGLQEPVDPAQANQGVLPGLEGTILQRGGEELVPKKVPDRLTLV